VTLLQLHFKQDNLYHIFILDGLLECPGLNESVHTIIYKAYHGA